MLAAFLTELLESAGHHQGGDKVLVSSQGARLHSQPQCHGTGQQGGAFSQCRDPLPALWGVQSAKLLLISL